MRKHAIISLFTSVYQGYFNWAWLTHLKLESMHSQMLFHAAREWSGLRSWYSLFGFIQCGCLLPK